MPTTRGVTLAEPHHEALEDEGHSDSEEESEQGGIGQYFFGLFGRKGGDEDSEVSRAAIENQGDDERVDLEGLFAYFDELQRDGVRLVETTYIVNKWALGGIIPFTHHGFCFKTSRGEYFSLDFSRKGIVWDTYGDEPPDLPDGTTFTQVFRINVDPAPVRRYCEETKPFQWMQNDCESWSKGLMMVLGISTQNRRSKQVCGVASPPPGSVETKGTPIVDAGKPRQASGRRQRTGDCL